MDETRKCRKCLQVKSMQDFSTGRARCKRCCADAMKEYRSRDEVKAKINERDKKRAKTPERKNAQSLRKRWGEQMYKILRLDPKDY